MNSNPRIVQVHVPQYPPYQQVANNTPVSTQVQQQPVQYVVVVPQNQPTQPQQICVIQTPQTQQQTQQIKVVQVVRNNDQSQQNKPTTATKRIQSTVPQQEARPLQSPQKTAAINTLPKNIQPFHEFKPMDHSKESQIKYVKWTNNFRIFYVIVMLCFLLWLYLLINNSLNHYKETGTLQWGYCDSSVSYYSCHDDHYEYLCDIYCEDSDGTGWIHPCWDDHGDDCEPYNNTSYGTLVARILLLPMIIYFLYKLYKSVFQGIKLPKLEDTNKSIGDKIYDKKYDLRPIIDKYIHSHIASSSDSVSNNDTSEHGNFVYFIWTASLVLFLMKVLVRDLPVVVLNFLSSSADLHVIASVIAVMDVLTLILIFILRNSCDLENGCRMGNDLDYYPPKNLKFIPVMSSRMILSALNFSIGIIQASMTLRSSAESDYDMALRAVNFVSGMYRIVGYCGSFFNLLFKFHFYWQKESVSKREALLLRDLIRSLFSWLMFKVIINDDDKYIYVNEKQASSEVLKCDPRTAYGKGYYPWLLGVSGVVVYGMLLLLSLIYQ